jgi:DNA repair exonuclease SbcCD ATPase subunit
MIIKSIGLRNFKSYGNNIQKLSFNEKAELILLTGKNGNGKSSLLESIDFSLFNIVRGKNSKRVPNYILPNRKNKNLEVEINFHNWNDEDIIINRKLNPKSLNVSINGIDKTGEYDLMSQKEKDNVIGLEYNTYKSLISLNLADFANFISLDTETKRKLLNKIFDLDEMDEYSSITKELHKNMIKRKEKIETHILSNENNIRMFKENIESVLEKSGVIIEKSEIKEKVLILKEKYLKLESEIKDINFLIMNLNNKIEGQKTVISPKKDKIYKDELQLSELNSKIEIFKGGTCPLCKTKLTDNSHISELETMNESYSELSSEILELKRSFKLLKDEIYSNIEEKRKLITERDEKKFEFDVTKNEIRNLKLQYEQNAEIVSIDEMNKNILTIEADSEKYNQGLNKLNSKLENYEKLIDILSEKGIRKNIITNLVNPINEHLTKYLIDLESKYSVKLNDEFDAVIKENYFDDIHIESLSTGEARKINIAIALSYMETILSMNKKTNILFMDEVFASVDPENIDTMLKVVRGFSNKNNINVIIVNHSNFDTAKFDRVIYIDKELGYSKIIEIKS